MSNDTAGSAGGESTSLERARSRRLDLHDTMGRLEAAAAAPKGDAGDWNERVRIALDALGEALEAHIEETEGPDGVLAEIVQLQPRLTSHADQLKAEHSKLTTAQERVRDSLTDVDQDAARIRRRVTTLLGHLVVHRQNGSDLVYEAYNLDIGGTG